MPITYNGVTIPTNADVIKYNGNDVDIVTYNGVTIWEKIKAYITFNKNAEAATGSMAQQAGGTGVVLNKNTFARTNCNFLGWNTASDATSALYADGATVDISQDSTLYAVWEMNVSIIAQSLTFIAGSGMESIKSSGSTLKGISWNSITLNSEYSYVHSAYFDCCAATKAVFIVKSTNDNNIYAGYNFSVYIEDNDGNTLALSYKKTPYDVSNGLMRYVINSTREIAISTLFRNKMVRLKIRFDTGLSSGSQMVNLSFGLTLRK